MERGKERVKIREKEKTPPETLKNK